MSSQGAIQVYSKLLDGHLVTVVGEVPPQTVIQVGDSVRFGGRVAMLETRAIVIRLEGE